MGLRWQKSVAFLFSVLAAALVGDVNFISYVYPLGRMARTCFCSCCFLGLLCFLRGR